MADQVPSDALTTEPAQVDGCRRCGTTAPPLHPDGATSTPVTDGVVRDSVVCTSCLVIP